MKRRSKYTQKSIENDFKRRLMITYRKQFQTDSDDPDDEDNWTKCVHVCKVCRREFTSLLQHIAKWSKCGQQYSQDDLNDLRFGIKIISKENRKDRDQKEYYQENKEHFAERYQEHQDVQKATKRCGEDDQPEGGQSALQRRHGGSAAPV